MRTADSGIVTSVQVAPVAHTAFLADPRVHAALQCPFAM